jgi:hypothetical protein
VSLIVEQGPWRAAISSDEPSARYEVRRWVTASVVASAKCTDIAPARAVIELRRRSGGIVPHALVGGELLLGDGGSLRFEVGESNRLAVGDALTCASSLARRSLVPGLPPEFALAALDGLVKAATAEDPPAGTIRVDRGGYDEVDSSQISFEYAASLLFCALREGALARPPEAAVRRLMATW